MSCTLAAPGHYCEWGQHWRPHPDWPQARQMAIRTGPCQSEEAQRIRANELDFMFDAHVRSELANRHGAAYKQRVKAAADAAEEGRQR
jgi:hypothetical protein